MSFDQPEFHDPVPVDRLREEIHAVAARGRSNTDYHGSLTELRQRRHADTE